MDAYFDMISGISGNMVLGALLDLGLELEDLQNELDKLGLSDEYEFHVHKVQRQGITGTHVEVKLTEDQHQHQSREDHEHDHKHHHEASDHDHDHSHQHDHEHHHSDADHSHNHNSHHHHGRNLNHIRQLINSSDLAPEVKESSLEIFRTLAEAEAKIHGSEIEEIHFHEVGAVDAIVDIVGAVIGLNLMEIDRIFASKIHTGTGFVECAHGKMPVPAPATMEILEGTPIYSTGIKSELVTPTGAAIIKTLAEDFAVRPDMKIDKTGYGAGTRQLDIPNLLRVNLGEINQGKKKV